MSEVANMVAQYMLVLTPIFEVCIISTVIVAFWQRARLATVRMMRERNEAIAARDQDERDIAALAERARIARDMHDVVAHTLSIIIVQSDGGRYAGTHDPRWLETPWRRFDTNRNAHCMTCNVFWEYSGFTARRL